MDVMALTVDKIVCLLVGLGLCYMGYGLFLVDVWGQSGDVRVSFSDYKLVLRGGAPGIFFALFAIVVFRYPQRVASLEATAPRSTGAPGASLPYCSCSFVKIFSPVQIGPAIKRFFGQDRFDKLLWWMDIDE